MRLWHIISAMIFVACVTWAATIWFGQVVDKAPSACTAAEEALGECTRPTNDGRPFRIDDGRPFRIDDRPIP